LILIVGIRKLSIDAIDLYGRYHYEYRERDRDVGLLISRSLDIDRECA